MSDVEKDGSELGVGGRFGVGGGRGGVDSWARKAGEEPGLSELVASCPEGDEEEEDVGVGVAEEWYATPENVEGVWNAATRHRTKWKELEGGVMWVLEASAGDLAKRNEGDVGFVLRGGQGKRGKEREKKRRRGKRRRKEVERILSDIEKV